jgi:hypothetical protein
LQFSAQGLFQNSPLLDLALPCVQRNRSMRRESTWPAPLYIRRKFHATGVLQSHFGDKRCDATIDTSFANKFPDLVHACIYCLRLTRNYDQVTVKASRACLGKTAKIQES